MYILLSLQEGIQRMRTHATRQGRVVALCDYCPNTLRAMSVIGRSAASISRLACGNGIARATKRHGADAGIEAARISQLKAGHHR